VSAAAYVDEYVQAGDLRLHYTDFNPSGERTTVLVHGLQVQAHTWDPLAEELMTDRRVVCPDLRGHGLSGWPPEGYLLDGFVDDLDAVIEATGAGSVELVGHSLGARIAIAYAARRPPIVEKLILSDAGPELPPAANAFTQKIVGAIGGDVRGFADEEQAYSFYRERHPEWKERFIDLHVCHQLRRNWAGKLIFRADPDLFWILGSAGRRDDARLWAALEACTMPTLIMWGRRSDFFTEDIAERMLELLPQGSLVRMDSGHYIPREIPEAFLAQVRDFLGIAERGHGKPGE
jgi:pimeloyl-ACP methyl ester carboxylesterase